VRETTDEAHGKKIRGRWEAERSVRAGQHFPDNAKKTKVDSNCRSTVTLTWGGKVTGKETLLLHRSPAEMTWRGPLISREGGHGLRTPTSGKLPPGAWWRRGRKGKRSG